MFGICCLWHGTVCAGFGIWNQNLYLLSAACTHVCLCTCAWICVNWFPSFKPVMQGNQNHRAWFALWFGGNHIFWEFPPLAFQAQAFQTRQRFAVKCGEKRHFCVLICIESFDVSLYHLPSPQCGRSDLITLPRMYLSVESSSGLFASFCEYASCDRSFLSWLCHKLKTFSIWIPVRMVRFASFTSLGLRWSSRSLHAESLIAQRSWMEITK